MPNPKSKLDFIKELKGRQVIKVIPTIEKCCIPEIIGYILVFDNGTKLDLNDFGESSWGIKNEIEENEKETPKS